MGNEEARSVRRDANRGIAEHARQLEFAARVPFLCECSDQSCYGFARMPLDAFDVIATQPGWSIIGDAHGVRAAVIDSETDTRVMEMGARAA